MQSWSSSQVMVRAGWVSAVLVGAVALAAGLLAGPPQAQAAVAAPPANDTYTNAVSVNSLPFLSASINISEATSAGDPTPLSGPGYTNNTSRGIWFKLVNPASAAYTFTTDVAGTTLADTVLTVYTSTSATSGPFTQVACNDDDGPGTLSTITTTLSSNPAWHYWLVAYQYSALPPLPGETDVQVSITGGGGGGGGGGPLTYTVYLPLVLKQNVPPVANAGSDQLVYPNTGVTLNGTASTDTDGHTPLTYRWTQTAGPAATLSNANAAQPTFTAPNSPGSTLTFQLAVTDTLGLADPTPDTVNIVLRSLPTANAGPDQTVVVGAQVTLDGSGSSSPHGAIGYSWAQTGGPSVTLSNASAAQPTFTAPASATVLTFTLTVSDGPLTAADTVVITVNVPVCPTTSSNSYAAHPANQVETDNPLRPAWNHGDKNLALRSYGFDGSITGANLQIANLYPDDDPNAPRLRALFGDRRIPTVLNAYDVNTWNWAPSPDPGTRGGPIVAPWPFTMGGLAVTPGEVIYTPFAIYNLGSGLAAMVLYADATRLTLVVGREDTAAAGYVIHIEGFCTDPNLLATYNSLEGARYLNPAPSQHNLVGLTPFQPLGTASLGELKVAIRDSGAFMDIRSQAEWWDPIP